MCICIENDVRNLILLSKYCEKETERNLRMTMTHSIKLANLIFLFGK